MYRYIRTCFFYLLLSSPVISALAQAPLSYKVHGSINVDTGLVTLTYHVDSAFYLNNFKPKTVRIINGKFEFEGTLPYPQGVILLCGKGYLSKSFVIEPGEQTLICNIDSNRKMPLVNNRAMTEYTTAYLPAFGEVNRKSNQLDVQWDSLKRAYNNNVPNDARLPYMRALKMSYAEGDKTLLKYVQQHPDSYLAFWHFIDLSRFGYENIFSTIYNAFSAELKNSYTGKVLGEKLATAGSLTAIGKSFPSLTPVTAFNQPLIKAFYNKNKFTLIDFWYSNCGPCIAQFDGFKEIYKNYRGKGLEIIAVSTDKITAKKNWQATIKKHDLPWLQYWDKNGAESYQLSITVFPTNFLVNDKGIIIQKNLSPAELKDFLKNTPSF